MSLLVDVSISGEIFSVDPLVWNNYNFYRTTVGVSIVANPSFDVKEDNFFLPTSLDIAQHYAVTSPFQDST